MVRFLSAIGVLVVAVVLVPWPQDPVPSVVVRTRGTEVSVTPSSADASTRFRAASLSKSFTAVAVMQLVEDGRFGLDDRVSDLLPEFSVADPRGSRITVRQLLNHSSGITDLTLGFDQYAPGPRTGREAVALLDRTRLAFAPGTDWDYCNVNYWVAGRLVEVVSGLPLSEYLQDGVFGPLGLTRTSMDEIPADAVDVATPNTWAFGRPVSLGTPRSFAGGAGGITTSAGDLGRWLSFHAGAFPSPVLSSGSLDELHRRQSPLVDLPVGYALGWWDGIPADGGEPRTSHSGSGPGVSSYQGLFRDGTGLGVLVAADAPRADLIAASVRNSVDAPASPGPWRDLAFTVVALSCVALTVRRRPRSLPGAALSTCVVVLICLLPVIATRIGGRQVSWMVLWHTYPVPAGCLAFAAAALAIGTVLGPAFRDRGVA